MSEIDLRSGLVFDFINPKQETILIEDIAWALSYTCRFVGQSLDFYSVAQHSVAVSKIVPEDQKLAALLHDAAEAYIGDVSRPLKKLLPDYKIIEDNIEAAIAKRFGLPATMTPEIKNADMILLRTEQRDLIKSYDPSWNRGHEPLPDKIFAKPPFLAVRDFLKRYEQLNGRYV